MLPCTRFAAFALVFGLLLSTGCGPGDDETADEVPTDPGVGPGEVPVDRPGDRPDDGPGDERPRRPDAGRGEALYVHYCAACHGPNGRADSVNAHYFPGLEWSDFTRSNFLTDRGEERIRKTITGGGRAVSGGSQWMPAYGGTLDDGEVDDLIAFLASLPRRRPEPLVNLSTSYEAACATCHRVGGAELVRQTNCAGCHALEGFERRVVAPDLAGVGSKFTRSWFYHYLEMPFNRRQTGFLPNQLVRMPDFRLTVEERIDLAEHMATWTDLDLAETYQPPDLEGEELKSRALELIDRHACLACHKLGADGGKVGPDLTDLGAGQWTAAWVYNWIRDPERYLPDSPMPDLGLTVEEARILTAYLTTRGSQTAWTGQQHDAVPEGQPPVEGASPPYPDLTAEQRAERAERGRVLFDALGCFGCHPVGNRVFDPATDLVGPSLDMAGHRLDRDWLFEFLWEPKTQVRPDLAPARMPRIRYTQDEVVSVIEYLTDHAESRWGDLRRERLEAPIPEADAATGRRLFAEKDCHSCHTVGAIDFGPVGSPYYDAQETARRRRWAPDLAQADRLEAWWAFQWIKDPTAFDEASLMPRIGLSDEEIAHLLEFLRQER